MVSRPKNGRLPKTSGPRSRSETPTTLKGMHHLQNRKCTRREIYSATGRGKRVNYVQGRAAVCRSGREATQVAAATRLGGSATAAQVCPPRQQQPSIPRNGRGRPGQVGDKNKAAPADSGPRSPVWSACHSNSKSNGRTKALDRGIAYMGKHTCGECTRQGGARRHRKKVSPHPCQGEDRRQRKGVSIQAHRRNLPSAHTEHRRCGCGPLRPRVTYKETKCEEVGVRAHTRPPRHLQRW